MPQRNFKGAKGAATLLRIQSRHRQEDHFISGERFRWHDDAVCREVGLEIMEHITPDSRRVCRECPVKFECLQTALDEEAGLGPGLRFMVRGGIGPTERYKLSLKRKVCWECKTPVSRTRQLCPVCAGRKSEGSVADKLLRKGQETWRRTCIQCGHVVTSKRYLVDGERCGVCMQKGMSTAQRTARARAGGR